MTSCMIRYQTRRKNKLAGIGQGEWQDKEVVVLAGDDAIEAVDAMADIDPDLEFRLKRVVKWGYVDIIAQRLR